jgi:hypothetical protein
MRGVICSNLNLHNLYRQLLVEMSVRDGSSANGRIMHALQDEGGGGAGGGCASRAEVSWELGVVYTCQILPTNRRARYAINGFWVWIILRTNYNCMEHILGKIR